MNEDERVDQERLELRERARNLHMQVMPLLEQLAPHADMTMLETACGEVVSSIMSYQSQLSAKVSLAAKRRDLLKMKKVFQECLTVLDPSVRPFGALLSLRIAQLDHRGLNGNLRELRRQLESAIVAATDALSALQILSPHQGDQHQVELAARVRLTLGKTLGLRVVMKPDAQLMSANPGRSANYSRLLRLALQLAGKRPPNDLHYLMKNGRDLLRLEGVAVLNECNLDDYPKGTSLLTYEKFDDK